MIRSRGRGELEVRNSKVKLRWWWVVVFIYRVVSVDLFNTPYMLSSGVSEAMDKGDESEEDQQFIPAEGRVEHCRGLRLT